MKKSYTLGLSLLFSCGTGSFADTVKEFNLKDGISTVKTGDYVHYFINDEPDVISYNWILPPGLYILKNDGDTSLDAYVRFTSKSGEISVVREFNNNDRDTVRCDFNVCRPISTVNDISINMGDSIMIAGEYRKDADIYYELTEKGDNCETVTAHRLTVIPSNSEMTKPYLQTITSNSVWITWKTSYEGESIVEYGESLTDNINYGTSEELSSKYYWHSVELTNLSPETSYNYRVKTGDNISETYRFTTPPEIGSKKKMRILLMGDHQIKSRSGYEWLMQAAKRKIEEKYGNPEESVAMIMNVGDQVDIGTLDQYEQIHFYKSSLLSPNIPIMTCVGNHETYSDTGMKKYAAHFHYEDLEYKGIKSDTENYYAYQIGRILFVVLSTEHTGDAQKEWIRKVTDAVKDDETVDFMISVNHRPIQAEQYIGDISSWVRNEIVPILSETSKHVLNFGGHHHLYHRGQLADYPLYHIINGGASWDQLWGMSSEEDYDDVQKTIDYWGYQILEFYDNEMKAECYAIGNKHIVTDNILIDSFSRKFGEPAPSKPFIKEIADTLIQPCVIEGSEFNTDHKYPLNTVRYQISTTEDFKEYVLDNIRDIENMYGSTGNPLHIPVDLNEYKNITSLELEKDKLKNGRYYIRLSHRDSNMEWSEWSDHKTFVISESISGDPAISIPVKSYRQGETVTIKYDFAPEKQNAWVGVYHAGDVYPLKASTKWTYTSGSAGEFKFTLDDADEYYAILFKDGGYTAITEKLSFYVGPQPEFTTDKDNYNENDTVKVTFRNVPYLKNDWFGVYRTGNIPGQADIKSSSWKYVSRAENDSLLLLGTGSLNAAKLSKGYYFLSYFTRGGYFEPAERTYFSVGELISSLESEKANYAPHEDIIIRYKDGPGTPKDWVGMYQVDKDIDVDELDGFYYTYGETNGYITIPAGELPAADYFSALYINDSYEEVSPRIYISIGKSPELIQSFNDEAYILSFNENQSWGDSISDIVINNIPLDKNDYNVIPGRIEIYRSASELIGSPVIIKANGWQDNEITANTILDIRDIISSSFSYNANEAAFSYNSEHDGNSLCEIFDMSGIKIRDIRMKKGFNSYSIKDLGKGIYVIIITENNISQSFKIVVN